MLDECAERHRQRFLDCNDGTWDISDAASMDRLRDALHRACVGQMSEEEAARWSTALGNSAVAMVDSLIGARAVEYVEQGGVQRYQISFLLQSFLLACNLRRDSLLRSTLSHAMKILFPPGLVSTLLKALEDKRIPLPSASSLSQMKYVVDVAYMRLRRDLNKINFATPGSAAVYFEEDSSPQGSYNWLNSEVTHVLAADIVAVARALKRLVVLSRQALVTDPEAHERAKEELMGEIRQRCHHHHNPPVGLGSGRSSVAHELHAFYWALYLETGDATILSNEVACAVANTSDRGT